MQAESPNQFQAAHTLLAYRNLAAHFGHMVHEYEAQGFFDSAFVQVCPLACIRRGASRADLWYADAGPRATENREAAGEPSAGAGAVPQRTGPLPCCLPAATHLSPPSWLPSALPPDLLYCTHTSSCARASSCTIARGFMAARPIWVARTLTHLRSWLGRMIGGQPFGPCRSSVQVLLHGGSPRGLRVLPRQGRPGARRVHSCGYAKS